MSTLKIFLKDTNKEELLDDLKSLQKCLELADFSKSKKNSSNRLKSKNKKSLFSFNNKK